MKINKLSPDTYRLALAPSQTKPKQQSNESKDLTKQKKVYKMGGVIDTKV